MLLTMEAVQLQALLQHFDTFRYNAHCCFLRGLKVLICAVFGNIYIFFYLKTNLGRRRGIDGAKDSLSALKVTLRPSCFSLHPGPIGQSAQRIPHWPVFCHVGCLSTNLAQGWNGSGGRSAVDGISNKTTREKKKRGGFRHLWFQPSPEVEIVGGQHKRPAEPLVSLTYLTAIFTSWDSWSQTHRHAFHCHSAAPAVFSLFSHAAGFLHFLLLPKISHNYSRPQLSSTPPFSNPDDPSSSTAVLPWKPLRRGKR